MTGKDLEEGFYKKNHLISVGVKILIASLILGAAAGGFCYYLLSLADVSENMGFIGFFAVFIAGALLIVSLIYLIMGAVGKANVTKFVNKVGEEKFMNHIANESLCVYSVKNRPVTIITTKFIIEVDRGVYRSTGIDYCYGYSYKGSTSIRAYDLKNRCTSFAYGIILRSDDAAQIYQALAKVNPEIILGYSFNNSSEHKKRMKAAKLAAKQGE